jgi:hypothetical protein
MITNLFIGFVPRIERLTESQLSQLLLNEELHYPRYLEEMTDIILQWCKDDISSLLNNNENNGDFLHFFKNSQYADRLSLSINISEGNMFSNIKAQYYNEYGTLGFNKTDKKLNCPNIYLNITLDKNGICNEHLLKTSISHELMHLYDDWKSLSQGNEPINTNQDLIAAHNMMFQNTDKLLQNIGKLLYLSNKFEKKAFITQVYNELKAVGCTDENYREKYKETITYKNYNKLKNVIKQEITSSSDNELKNINHVLNTEYKETHLPKISNNKFDVEIYKNKVNKFIDSVCHDFIKKYGGILTAYLNDFKMFNNKI